MISPVLRKRPKNSKTLKTLHPLEIIQFIHFMQEGKLPPLLPSQPDAAACPAVAPLSASLRSAAPPRGEPSVSASIEGRLWYGEARRGLLLIRRRGG